MKPFPIQFDFESSAYGVDYAIKLVKSPGQWLVHAFLGFPPGTPGYHALPRMEALDTPPDATVMYGEFTKTGSPYVDRSRWWIGLAWSPQDGMETIVGEVESIIAQLANVAYEIEEEATIGGPAWRSND